MAAKINKKDLEEPDKLQLLFLSIRAFAEKHRTRISIGAALFLLVALFAGGWFIYQLNYDKNGAKIYARVFENAMRTGSPAGDEAAITGYKDLIARYPRSRAAITARLKLGNLYYNRREIDTAIGFYEDFLQKVPPGSDLVPLGYHGLGSCHEFKKDYKKAIELFEMAAKKDTDAAFEVINYGSMARVYEAMNDAAKAVEFYRKALTKTTDPVMTLYLKRKISILG
jgi:tetratricopeptide (TPR) repeat protein